MATLNAMYKKEHRQMKFMAALQGVDIDKDKKEEGGEAVTFEEVKARALAKLTGDKNIENAARYGFDQIDGLGYSIIGLDDGDN